jgi:biotin carboxyl carrier protein
MGTPARVPSGEVAVKAPMPGLVVAVAATSGQEVKIGQGLIILEAMKMENELRAPRAGRVKAIRVSPGQVVDKDQVLVVIE